MSTQPNKKLHHTQEQNKDIKIKTQKEQIDNGFSINQMIKSNT